MTYGLEVEEEIKTYNLTPVSRFLLLFPFGFGGWASIWLKCAGRRPDGRLVM